MVAIKNSLTDGTQKVETVGNIASQIVGSDIALPVDIQFASLTEAEKIPVEIHNRITLLANVVGTNHINDTNRWCGANTTTAAAGSIPLDVSKHNHRIIIMKNGYDVGTLSITRVVIYKDDQVGDPLKIIDAGTPLDIVAGSTEIFTVENSGALDYPIIGLGFDLKRSGATPTTGGFEYWVYGGNK